MTTTLDRIRRAQAEQLDDKRTRKALKRVLPGVEWIYTKAYGLTETKLLLSAGWEPVNNTGGDLIDKIMGTSLTTVTTMKKRNPEA